MYFGSRILKSYPAIYFLRVGLLELTDIIVKIDLMVLELELISGYNSFSGLKSVVGSWTIH